MADVAADTPLDRNFQERLRAAREAKGLTQADVANRLGVTRPSYTAIETGKASPSLTTIYKVAKALKIDAAELLGAAAVV